MSDKFAEFLGMKPESKEAKEIYKQAKVVLYEQNAKITQLENEQFNKQQRETFNREVGIEVTDRAWDAIFKLAWEWGHSSGYNEVELYISDLADIAKALMGKD